MRRLHYLQAAGWGRWADSWRTPGRGGIEADGQMIDRWKDAWIVGRVGGQTDTQTDTCVGRQIHRRIDAHWADGFID
jgi:hypothetical protein